MEKVIILLDGYSEGKNIFQEEVKKEGYWVWNVNHRNVLGMVAGKLLITDGEDEKLQRDKKYYDFLKALKDLADQYFDFERSYATQMINRFAQNDKVNVLIIHSCSDKLAVELQDFYPNCFDIFIGNEDIEDSTYCKTLNYKSDEFKNDVVQVMRILTKSFKGKGE